MCRTGVVDAVETFLRRRMLPPEVWARELRLRGNTVILLGHQLGP